MNSFSREIDIDLSGDAPKILAEHSSQGGRLTSLECELKRGTKRLTGGRSPVKYDETLLLVDSSDDTADHGRCKATDKPPKKRRTKSASCTDLSNSMDIVIQKNPVMVRKIPASSGIRELQEFPGLDSTIELVIARPNIAVTSRKKQSVVKQKKIKLAVSMILDPSFDVADAEYELPAELTVLEYSNFTVSEETSIPVKADRNLFMTFPLVA